MNIATLLEMAASGMADRVAVGSAAAGTTYEDLYDRGRRLATVLRTSGAERLVLVDLNSDAIPMLLFGSALAGVPFVPLNYRLADDQLRGLVARAAPALVVVGDDIPGRVGPVAGVEYLTMSELQAALSDTPASVSPGEDADGVAVLLF